MRNIRLSSLGVRLLAGAAICFTSSPPAAAAKPTIIRGSPTPTVTVFASGFNNPRGLKFGPDGMLYVAEAGTGGSNSTVGQCEQVGPPVGPYVGSPTGGRISRVDSGGNRTTVTSDLPSSNAQAAIGGDVEGVADVAFLGGTLYALVAGGGCAHGVASKPNGVYRIGSGGTPTLVADLGAFQHAHPVAHPSSGDFEPEGTWYSMVARNGALYALEPNHGELDKVTAGGAVSRVVDISASQGHIVPTALASHGTFYVGNLGLFPITPGSSKIMQVTPSGQLRTVATGLTTVLGVAFDSQSRMYALEMTATAGFPAPGAGRLIRIGAAGRKETLVDGLNFPTGMTFGPDGALYVSAFGLGPPGAGEVLRIRIDD